MEKQYQELRRERRQARLTERLPAIQKAAQEKGTDFDPDTLYDEMGLPQ